LLGYANIQLLLTALFIIGFIYEFNVATHRFFVLPPAVFTLYCFIYNMAPGVLHFSFGFKDTALIVGDEAVVRGTWYTLVAVHILWMVFYLIPDFRMKVFHNAEIKRVPILFIFTLIGISVSAFIIGIRLGVYGYYADQDNVNYVSYIRFAVNLGWLAIIILTVYDYENLQRRMLLYFLIGCYFVIGLAFGSKSTAVVPIVVLIISLYFTKRVIKMRYWLTMFLSISLAYMVVEPFRSYYGPMGQSYNTRDVSEVALMYSDAYQYSEGNETNYGLAFIDRLNYAVPLAKTIEYADDTNYYASDEWEHLALSPLYAIIPRFLWESKPLANFGVWASVNIFGFENTTSTGITPQGYAYLVLRFAGIVIFFALSGVIQRLMFNFLYLNGSFIPFYIFMYLEIGYPSVVPWTYVAGTIQSIIFLSPLIMFLVYVNRKRAYRDSRGRCAKLS